MVAALFLPVFGRIDPLVWACVVVAPRKNRVELRLFKRICYNKKEPDRTGGSIPEMKLVEHPQAPGPRCCFYRRSIFWGKISNQ